MTNDTTTKATTLPEHRRQLRSVKSDSANIEAVRFFAPFYNLSYGALPPTLPNYDYNGFLRPRDILLLSTVDKEDMWSAAVSLAISKISSRSWEIDSEVPLRRKRVHNWLMEAGAGMGIYGFSDFIAAHLSSYLLTGAAFVEIERKGKGQSSPVINIHHLNPLRCRLTGNNRRPVNYLGDDGKVRPLEWWQVMILVDQPYPNYTGYQYYKGAAERSYNAIRRLSNVESFIVEKISGRRPLTINFVGGITKSALDDALTSTQMEADVKGLRSYMGAAIVPVLSDQAVTNVSIPIAELPDITDVQRERDYAALIYADNIGLDPQDLNPQLVGRQGLGSAGNQSMVLNDKQTGRGLARWAKSFTQKLNALALSESVTFTFVETDLRDQKQEAENKNIRAQWRKTMIETGEITADQARNLAVDEGDLPREFIEKDATGADKLRDSEKPESDEEREEREARKEWTELYH